MLALILIGSGLALAAIAARQAAHALVRSITPVLPLSRDRDANEGFELVEVIVDGARSFAISYPPTPVLSPVLGCEEVPDLDALPIPSTPDDDIHAFVLPTKPGVVDAAIAALADLSALDAPSLALISDNANRADDAPIVAVAPVPSASSAADDAWARFEADECAFWADEDDDLTPINPADDVLSFDELAVQYRRQPRQLVAAFGTAASRAGCSPPAAVERVKVGADRTIAVWHKPAARGYALAFDRIVIINKDDWLIHGLQPMVDSE